MKWLLVVLNFILFSASLNAQQPPSPMEILTQADKIRNPQTDYVMRVDVTRRKSNRKDSVSNYEVMVNGREKTLVLTLSPIDDKGRILLMLGKDLWVHLPNLTKPLHISLGERFKGEISYGDIVRANFTRDYNPRLSKSKEIDGKEYYVLELTANAPDVTYFRVVLWVEEGSYRPLKAEFYAVSGRLLKTCTYGNYRKAAGLIRPTRIVMTDALLKGQNTVIDCHDMELKKVPDKYFTKNYMKMLAMVK